MGFCFSSVWSVTDKCSSCSINPILEVDVGKTQQHKCTAAAMYNFIFEFSSMCVCCGRHQHHQSPDGGVLHFSRCQFRRNDLRMPARSSLVELASNCGQCHWLCSVLRAKQSSNITLLILRGASQWKTIVFIFVFVCCCHRDDSINRIYSQTGAKIRIGNATIHNNIE